MSAVCACKTNLIKFSFEKKVVRVENECCGNGIIMVVVLCMILSLQWN